MRERFPPSAGVLLVVSAVVAVMGGCALGINGGALDLQWTDRVYAWAQLPHNAPLLAFLRWGSREHGGQLPSVLLITGSAVFWLFCLSKGHRSSLSTAFHGRRKNAEVIVLASALMALTVPLVKGTVARQRPRYHKDNVDYTPWYDCVSRNRENPFNRGSFPSGHTAQAAIVFGVLYWTGKAGRGRFSATLIRGVFALGIFAYVALIGFSRIALAKHFISDVFFGLLIGFWIVSFSAWIVFHRLAPHDPLFAPVLRWRRRG